MNYLQRLERQTFEISRHAEYFSAKELTYQTGIQRSGFATVVLKELVDNALDACEKGNASPSIDVVIRDTSRGAIEISVSDNGPGIPEETVAALLNFDTRTSDNAAYRSPTRGAQGNALKTVLGIPYALGSSEPVVIVARGIAHSIQAWATPAGEVRVAHEKEKAGPTVGTKVTIRLPKFSKEGTQQRFRPREWMHSSAFFNPHASVKFTGYGEFCSGGDMVNRSQQKPSIFTSRRSRRASRSTARVILYPPTGTMARPLTYSSTVTSPLPGRARERTCSSETSS